jgi:Flp pilus assembly protein TadG
VLNRRGGSRRNQRGAVIIWLTLFLLVLIGFGSLSVDVAKLAAARTQLQNAADAAALAGASALDPATGVIEPTLALARAQTAAASNKAFIADPQPVLLSAADVTFPTPTRIQVKVRREGAQSVVTTLAQVLGIRRLAVTATATAKIDTAGSALCGVVPLGVSPNPGQSFQTGCANQYTLKVGGGAGSQGQYGALDFPACPNTGACAGMNPTGANTFRCLMTNGYCCPITVGQVLNTESGNMSGPTKQAINNRFAADAVSDEDICYSDYLSRGGTGQRVVLVPMTTPVAGNPQVTVLGFACFFLRNRPGSGTNSILTGEFMYQIIAGAGGGSATGPVVYSLRLVSNS